MVEDKAGCSIALDAEYPKNMLVHQEKSKPGNMPG